MKGKIGRRKKTSFSLYFSPAISLNSGLDISTWRRWKKKGGERCVGEHHTGSRGGGCGEMDRKQQQRKTTDFFLSSSSSSLYVRLLLYLVRWQQVGQQHLMTTHAEECGRWMLPKRRRDLFRFYFFFKGFILGRTVYMGGRSVFSQALFQKCSSERSILFSPPNSVPSRAADRKQILKDGDTEPQTTKSHLRREENDKSGF